MSEYPKTFVPADPLLRLGPSVLESAVIRAGELFTDSLARPYQIRSFAEDLPRFVDCGGNFEAVRCPGCRRDAMPWWQDAMGAWWNGDRRVLELVTPCCGTATSLNQLLYHWPQAFACSGVIIEQTWKDVTLADYEQMEAATGTPLRLIRGRI